MKKISKITICLNNFCDKRCDYCYRNSAENMILIKPKEFKYWKELAKFLAFTDDLEFESEIGIHFTGGEPFLSSYDMIEGIFTLQSVEMIKTSPIKKIKFGCITNLSDAHQLLNFLDRGYLYKQGVSISWDYTGNSREELEIRYLHERITEYYHGEYNDLYIKMAVTDKTIPHLYDGLTLLRSYDFTNLGYYFVNGTNDYEDDNIKEEFRKQLLKIRNNGDLCSYLYNYYDIRSIEQRPFCDKLGELLYIDTAGGIWPCAFYSDDTKVHGIENIDEFKLGDIFNGIRKYHKEIIEYPSIEWKEKFCHACSFECQEKIRKMKEIEYSAFCIP